MRMWNRRQWAPTLVILLAAASAALPPPAATTRAVFFVRPETLHLCIAMLISVSLLTSLVFCCLSTLFLQRSLPTVLLGLVLCAWCFCVSARL